MARQRAEAGADAALAAELGRLEAEIDALYAGWVSIGLYPIVNSQYSSTTLYQVSYNIRSLFF